MSKHTPGPWEVIAAKRGSLVVATETLYIAEVSHQVDDDTENANASLIAAAPTYYDAAEAIRAHVVAADRAERGNPCTLPSELVRALLDAHKSVYTIAAAKGG